MSNLPRLIGLVGYQRVGKTTTAKLLEEQHGYTWTRFAGPLKDMLRVLGLTDHELDGPLKNEPCALLGGKTPVQAMQTLGTEWGRKMIYSDLWLDTWKRRVEDLLHLGEGVVVDDVRFGNEAAAIRTLGGELWLVERPGFERASAHESEAFVAEVKAMKVIINEGSMAQLSEAVNTALWRNQ
jgi:hypothetical protein